MPHPHTRPTNVGVGCIRPARDDTCGENVIAVGRDDISDFYNNVLNVLRRCTSSDYETVCESFLNNCNYLNGFMSERWQWIHSELYPTSGIHSVTVD